MYKQRRRDNKHRYRRVPAMGGEIEGDGETLLTGLQVGSIEPVRLLRSTEGSRSAEKEITTQENCYRTTYSLYNEY
jgi:hypothetical protein